MIFDNFEYLMLLLVVANIVVCIALVVRDRRRGSKGLISYMLILPALFNIKKKGRSTNFFGWLFLIFGVFGMVFMFFLLLYLERSRWM